MRTASCVILILIMATVVLAQTDPVLPPGDSPLPTAFDRIKDAGTADDFKDAAYVIVCDSTVNRVNELGISYLNSYMLYKVLNDEGCRELAVVRRGYEPLSSYVTITNVNILRGDSVISVPVEKVLDLPASQSGIYWGDRIKVLQLPRLCVNDGIEIELFRKGYSYALLDNKAVQPDDERYIPPMPGEYFDIVLFEADVPVVTKKYVLKLPKDKRVHSKIYNGPMYSSTSYIADTTIYTWWNEDVPAWKSEHYLPDQSDIVTKVVIATVESWEAKSRWFFDVNEGQFKVTEAIKAKVDEIFANAGVTGGTEEEKAFELVHWVAQNIRYSGQTMGEGEGFTLHSGEMIFEQRSGVCKDIAGMLITMMRAADMDSYGAMTMAGSRIEKVPADQFNHCVVALKKTDGRFVMYDPTWVSFSRDIWSRYETEQHFLIGTPRGEGLSQIDYSPPEESPLRVTSKAEIQDDGTLIGTLEFYGEGGVDGRLRGILSRRPLSETENYICDMLHYLSNRVELLSYEHGELLDFKKGMLWKIRYRIPEYAMIVDGNFEFKSPMMQLTTNDRTLFWAGSVEWSEKREDDVFLWMTQLVDGNEEIKLPGGFKIDDPKQSEEIDETYAYFKGTSEMKNQKLSISQKAEVRRRQIPPEDYQGFRKAMTEARDYAKTVFRAEKGGAK